MALHPRRLTFPAALAATVLMFASACTGQDSGPGATGVPSPTAPPAPGEVVLPINAYLPTADDQARMGRARAILIDRCMRRFGLSFPQPSAAALEAGAKDNGVYGNKRRYGVTDAATAQRYGYHLPSTVDRVSQDGEPDGTEAGTGAEAGSAEGKRSRRRDPAYAAVLNGHEGNESERGARRDDVPSGGCVGEAGAKLAEAGSATDGFSYAKVASDIKADSHFRSMSSTRVTAAFKEWSRCMRDKGYSTTAPVGERLPFDIDSARVSEKEIERALADVACKERTRLVEIWSGEERRYQNAQIKEHSTELRTAAEEHRSRMKAITAILARE
ncbi:hypothetical protein ACIF9R_17940 [Streptomyces sp. NPDC086080]|uniref:hypothetical protein n=1 Tax=Streptomyces sp. NPDC086080 TaxID=3365748 RepID=UPI0037D655CC